MIIVFVFWFRDLAALYINDGGEKQLLSLSLLFTSGYFQKNRNNDTRHQAPVDVYDSVEM